MTEATQNSPLKARPSNKGCISARESFILVSLKLSTVPCFRRCTRYFCSSQVVFFCIKCQCNWPAQRARGQRNVMCKPLL